MGVELALLHIMLWLLLGRKVGVLNAITDKYVRSTALPLWLCNPIPCLLGNQRLQQQQQQQQNHQIYLTYHQFLLIISRGMTMGSGHSCECLLDNNLVFDP